MVDKRSASSECPVRRAAVSRVCNVTDRSDRSSCADRLPETGYKQAIVEQMDGASYEMAVSR